MKGLIIAGSLILVLILGAVGIAAVAYISNYNYGNRAETTIKAEYENMENILGQYSLKVAEAAQVPSMQKEDLLALYTGANASRYGANGSQAAMQWLKEQNPNLDQSTYIKVQQIIEAGRNKFENAQTKFIDTKRIYETNLGYLWKGFWLGVAGYPKINLDDYAIISSEHAQDAFDTKVDKGVKIR